MYIICEGFAVAVLFVSQENVDKIHLFVYKGNPISDKGQLCCIYIELCRHNRFHRDLLEQVLLGCLRSGQLDFQ